MADSSKGMIGYVKWLLWLRVRCPHVASYYTLENIGRDKVEWCRGCNRALSVDEKGLVFFRK